jgi:hypothetical protein
MLYSSAFLHTVLQIFAPQMINVVNQRVECVGEGYKVEDGILVSETVVAFVKAMTNAARNPDFGRAGKDKPARDEKDML